MDARPAAFGQGDLVWLLHRNAQRLGGTIEQIVQAHGLAGGVRDHVVLTALVTTDEPKTQVELGQMVGVDKTTLMAVLDRLEGSGLVARRLDPANRRVRIPEATDRGRALQAKVTIACRAAEAVPGLSATELKALRKLLIRLDDACEAAGMKVSGSCV